MFKASCIFIFLVYFSNSLNADTNYSAHLYSLDKVNTQKMFDLKISEKISDDKINITAQFFQEDRLQLNESAQISKKTADIDNYEIQQLQTKESGSVKVENNKILMSYTNPQGKTQTKSMDKPDLLVAPANFKHWLYVHFEELKQKQSLQIHFLVWDRLDTFKFKVSYLGVQNLKNKKAQHFKMNLSNPLLSAFVDPIQIWSSEDMTQILLYEGRVAVKQAQGLEFKNLDAKVEYFHDLKAVQ